jgi:iron donor protein CyaY
MKARRNLDKNQNTPKKTGNGGLNHPESFYQSCYTGAMMDEMEFRRLAESALEGLKKHLYACEEEESAGFEVEEQGGVLNVLFEEPVGKFVITSNAPVRQIWISALSTSFKLDWDATTSSFVLPRSGENLQLLVDRLIKEQLES